MKEQPPKHCASANSRNIRASVFSARLFERRTCMAATDGNNGRDAPPYSKENFMTRLKAVAVTIVLITSFAAAAEPPSQPIAIQVDGNVVTATGLTPGGACAVVVSWRVRTAIVETWRAGTADSEGAVSAKFPL